MNPRKKQSKKWTNIPPEFLNQIKTVFEENFQGQLTNKTLKVTGRIYPTEILLRVGVNNKGELRYNNFEVSLDHSQDKQDTVAQIHIAVDALGSLLFEYFENQEDHEIPYTWQQQPFENQTIWLQYTSENPDLESEANKLLGIDEDTLLHDEPELDLDGVEDEEKAELAAHDQADQGHDHDDDDEETTDISALDLKNPQIFKKKKKEDMH